ncbi:hypothetical protein [Methanobrevibacter sp.]|uniref:hypothetical protein n=1 Tax=Methanobrevibacter sp. TaxID=66852 RepID=UPI00388FDD66
MAKRKIATAITNSNGIATVEYEGQGVGKLDLHGEVEGIFQSETYSILDTLFFDDCTDNSKASSYYRYNNSVSEPSFDETGMFVERTSNGNGYLFIGQSNGTDNPYSLNFAIEFDVVSVTGDVRSGLGNGTWDVVRNMSANDHYKIEYYPNKQVITKNGGTPTESAKTNTGSFKWQLQFVGASSIKIKNIRVYSI